MSNTVTGKDQADLAHAYGLLTRGNLSDAQRICRRVIQRTRQHAGAVHMLGLTRKRAGDWTAAEKFMRTSIRMAPEHAEFYANLANLLRQQKRLSEAEVFYRQAIERDAKQVQAMIGLIRTLNDLSKHREAETLAKSFVKIYPSHANGWSAMAMTVRDQGRLGDAEQLYRHTLRIQPDFAQGHHNLGSLLCRLDRPEEALASLKKAESLGVQGFELAFNFGRTYLQLYQFDRAEESFARAVAQNPKDSDAQINLARVRFVLDQQNFDRGIAKAVKEFPQDSDLILLQAVVLRRAGNLEQARLTLERLLFRDPTPQIRSALAEVLHEQGNLEGAEAAIMGALVDAPEDTIVVENAVAILLARGRPDTAMPYIQQQRARQPLEQGWIAYETTAARLLGQPYYAQLCDYSRLVRVYDLGEPSKDLLLALEQRHRLSNHPLDQSLRHGSQTVRSLLTDQDPAIQAILRAFQDPLANYVQRLGKDPGHPMSARNSGSAVITGSWSVRLDQQGLHVNHFHPEGWISSAYYVFVPEEVQDNVSKAGWIKFGEPRFPVPGAAPELFVQPKPGRLVLFPSYLWHGTVPLAGIEPRLSIAFDANPGRNRS